MSSFSSYDGTELAYHVIGTGEPLICLPGGPMRASQYLGDLGGLDEHRQLILLDHRDTGDSARPSDPETYRIDRMVADVEALRAHLGLETMDILAHSAGANLVALYASAHPTRVAKLALITPGTRAVGLPVTNDDRRAAAQLRKNESWFAESYQAFERIWSEEEDDEDWDLIAPFFYGRWDEAARVHAAADEEQSSEEGTEWHYAEGVFHPEETRAALAELEVPVLILAGEYDFGPSPVLAMQLGECFPKAWMQLAVQPGAGHFPWLDDAQWFSGAVSRWLADN
jgi:pimeloyl-ACP methyl ester carboxylesterase